MTFAGRPVGAGSAHRDADVARQHDAVDSDALLHGRAVARRVLARRQATKKRALPALWFVAGCAAYFLALPPIPLITAPGLTDEFHRYGVMVEGFRCR